MEMRGECFSPPVPPDIAAGIGRQPPAAGRRSGAPYFVRTAGRTAWAIELRRGQPLYRIPGFGYTEHWPQNARNPVLQNERRGGIVMKTVRQLLQAKASKEIYMIAPDARVFDALKLMAEKDIGALVVVENERVAGILSERDYARKVILHGKSSHDIPVREIMTSQVVTVAPGQTVEECMQLMTDGRFRHLPVVEGGRLVGVVSIGDLVKEVISEQQQTIRELESYIHR